MSNEGADGEDDEQQQQQQQQQTSGQNSLQGSSSSSSSSNYRHYQQHHDGRSADDADAAAAAAAAAAAEHNLHQQLNPDGSVRMLEDFEDLPIPPPRPGRSFLRVNLSHATSPEQQFAALNQFQQLNNIMLPSLKFMLPLLDLHNVPRLEFNREVMETLRERLITRIDEIGARADSAEKESLLKTMLERAFTWIKIPTLQPVVMALLKNVDCVEEKYLKSLISDKSLYQKCDVSVKRHIWVENASLFGDEVSPLLIKYIQENEKIFSQIKDPGKTFFTRTPKQRRQSEVLQELTKMVGKNVVLYDLVLQFLRTLFLHTCNHHYCTLRVMLLMELHDANVTDITSMDPCHKFTWCLDACIRERTFDPKRLKELQGFLDSMRKSHERVYGDLAMALADPFAVHFIAQNIIRIMYQQIQSEALPRDNSTLQFLLRLLNLGLHSFEIFKTQVFKEPTLNVSIVTRFIPMLMSFMVDDQVRAVNAKLPQDDRESALAIIEHSGPPPDSFVQYINEDPLAAVLAVHYTAHAARSRDRAAVQRVFGCLATPAEPIFPKATAYIDYNLHLLASSLISLGEEFANEELCSVVFDEFFLPAIKGTIIHLLKLLWHCHQYLPKKRLKFILDTLDEVAPQTTEQVRTLIKELKDRIEKMKADAAAAAAANAAANSSTTKSGGGGSGTGAGASQQSQQQPSSATPAHSGATGAESIRHLMSPSVAPSATPSYMSPMSPAMSPFYGGPANAGAFSPMPPSPMSPLPYQSPMYMPSMLHGSGGGGGGGSSSGNSPSGGGTGTNTNNSNISGPDSPGGGGGHHY